MNAPATFKRYLAKGGWQDPHRDEFKKAYRRVSRRINIVGLTKVNNRPLLTRLARIPSMGEEFAICESGRCGVGSRTQLSITRVAYPTQDN